MAFMAAPAATWPAPPRPPGPGGKAADMCGRDDRLFQYPVCTIFVHAGGDSSCCTASATAVRHIEDAKSSDPTSENGDSLTERILFLTGGTRAASILIELHDGCRMLLQEYSAVAVQHSGIADGTSAPATKLFQSSFGTASSLAACHQSRSFALQPRGTWMAREWRHGVRFCPLEGLF